MDITELVQKKNPDFGRSALLEAFVNAHFDDVTGELLGKEFEFYRVLNLLGRKDLHLGDIPVRIGNISFEEKKAIHTRFLEFKLNAPKVKKTINESIKVGPYLKQLSTTELMAIEAFDSSGNAVTNPAVATTLAQAHLEGWISVKSLPMDAKEILMQCMSQGDMQAAFLLGSTRVLSDKIGTDGSYLVEKKEERRSYLTAAKAHGNPAAIDWFEHETMQEEMRDSVWDEENDKFYLDWINIDLQQALKFGPDAMGSKLFTWGVQLAESNQKHFSFSKDGKLDISAYIARHALALQWITEAAKHHAEARYYLATGIDAFIFYKKDACLTSYSFDDLISRRNLTEVELKAELIRSAAFPGGDIDPYYPAYIDLAEEVLSRIKNSLDHVESCVSLTEEIHRYLIEGVAHIEKPDCNQSIRIATLWENIAIEGMNEKPLQYYLIAARHSPFAAYKCAMLSLRSTKKDIDTIVIKSMFELAISSSPRHGNILDLTAKEYSDIALKIGWGIDSEPWSWEEASMLLVRQLDRQRYVPNKQNTWIQPTDVESLLKLNPSYDKHNKFRNDWREALSKKFERRSSIEPDASIQYGLKEKLRSIYFLYGASEPSAILKILSAIANDPNYLHSDLAMSEIDASSILIKYILSQLSLHEKDGQGKALGEFKKVLAITEAMQDGPSGRGASFIANSLQWLQKKSQDGINDAQPNCRRVMIRSEMNGPIADFGNRLLRIILKNLENELIPGKSMATEIIYKDRYINTPIKIALLAKTIEAIVNHLKELKRWNNSIVNIYAGEFEKPTRQKWGTRLGFLSSTEDRNEILKGVLAKFNILSSITEKSPPHGRAFIVRFNDHSELRVDLDKGISFWNETRSKGNIINDIDLNANIKQKVDFLTSSDFSIVTPDEENKMYVEWHEDKAVRSNTSH